MYDLVDGQVEEQGHGPQIPATDLTPRDIITVYLSSHFEELEDDQPHSHESPTLCRQFAPHRLNPTELVSRVGPTNNSRLGPTEIEPSVQQPRS